MILAVGLTPCLQQVLEFERIVPGQVNRAAAAHWYASGKSLNVGIALHHLGAASQVLSVRGGLTGEAIAREFAACGIAARWVTSSVATRVCTTLLERHSGTTTELVENAQPLEAEVLDRFLAAFRDLAPAADVVVFSGSLPAGTPPHTYAAMLRQMSGRAILDVRGDELLLALPQRPFLVKPNREELAKTAGHSLTSEAELRAAMRDLNARGAEWVVVTQGAGPVWVSSRDGLWQLTPPTVSVVNPIGCGDCLAAGIACAIDRGDAVIEAVRYGMGAAADNVRQLLSARLDPARVAQFAAQVQVASLN